MNQKTVEVETRFHFKNVNEAYEMIPFLKESLSSTNHWETHHFGLELFEKDQILRVGKNIRNNNEPQFYLGWKGPDHGKLVNIREEIDEEITSGIKDSAILALLGGTSSLATAESVTDEINRLDYHLFMSFSGHNKLGYYEPDGLHLKLMQCPILEWPILVEIEKTAQDLDEAFKLEGEILEITGKLQLKDRLVRKEPPTLLFETLQK